jgi:hypothetical protein
MKELYDDLHEACEVMSRELGDVVDKVRETGGKMSGADLDEIDKLTHSIKSIKTTMAMMDAEDDGAYSPRMMYNDGRSSRDWNGAYARGRNTRRDNMGRYSSRRAYDDGSDRM